MKAAKFITLKFKIIIKNSKGSRTEKVLLKSKLKIYINQSTNKTEEVLNKIRRPGSFIQFCSKFRELLAFLKIFRTQVSNLPHSEYRPCTENRTNEMRAALPRKISLLNFPFNNTIMELWLDQVQVCSISCIFFF